MFNMREPRNIAEEVQLSMKFLLPKRTKMLKNIDFPIFKPSDIVFILLINVKNANKV